MINGQVNKFNKISLIPQKRNDPEASFTWKEFGKLADTINAKEPTKCNLLLRGEQMEICYALSFSCLNGKQNCQCAHEASCHLGARASTTCLSCTGMPSRTRSLGLEAALSFPFGPLFPPCCLKPCQVRPGPVSRGRAGRQGGCGAGRPRVPTLGPQALRSGLYRKHTPRLQASAAIPCPAPPPGKRERQEAKGAGGEGSRRRGGQEARGAGGEAAARGEARGRRAWGGGRRSRAGGDAAALALRQSRGCWRAGREAEPSLRRRLPSEPWARCRPRWSTASATSTSSRSSCGSRSRPRPRTPRRYRPARVEGWDGAGPTGRGRHQGEDGTPPSPAPQARPPRRCRPCPCPGSARFLLSPVSRPVRSSGVGGTALTHRPTALGCAWSVFEHTGGVCHTVFQALRAQVGGAGAAVSQWRSHPAVVLATRCHSLSENHKIAGWHAFGRACGAALAPRSLCGSHECGGRVCVEGRVAAAVGVRTEPGLSRRGAWRCCSPSWLWALSRWGQWLRECRLERCPGGLANPHRRPWVS